MSDEMGRLSVLARISGRVQGVGYRDWCADEARKHGLTGWVRNRKDGLVEALFCGSQDAVEEMLEQARSGPRWANVDDIQTSPVLEPEEHETFERKPTV
ncbi:acylphosphatase [Roseibium limicola]|nr:acylphosphatase [Roseibium limicola]